MPLNNSDEGNRKKIFLSQNVSDAAEKLKGNLKKKKKKGLFEETGNEQRALKTHELGGGGK